MHVEVSGEGAVLLSLHGWGLNLRVFDALVTALPGWRHIRVDLPGHGKSAWDPRAAHPGGLARLARLVHDAAATHTASCFVLGWSLGAQIAIELAATVPAFVERLVLVSATPKFTASDDWPHGMAVETLARFEAALARDWRGTVRDFLELQVRGSAEGDRVLSELNTALLAQGEARPEALTAGLEALRRSDLRDCLGGVRQPTLVVAGQYDRITPPWASRSLAGLLADARYVELKRAGHAAFLSHTSQLAELLREFLR
jgi:pimeloyl-[acyl-carrier protein] methyl ester esterase